MAYHTNYNIFEFSNTLPIIGPQLHTCPENVEALAPKQRKLTIYHQWYHFWLFQYAPHYRTTIAQLHRKFESNSLKMEIAYH
jgi:hypothetical protein